MDKTVRLDKYLADMGIGSRSQIKLGIKLGKVYVEGADTIKPEMKIDPQKDRVYYEGKEIAYLWKEYIMLNKPAGVITATRDKRERTVMDLITSCKRKDLFPVGRLDKDTEGLLLLTNDGNLAHELLSPVRHVEKVYYAKVEGFVTQEEKRAFLEGVWIEEGVKTKPAVLNIIKSAPVSEVYLTLYEGKFHQVKRMFETAGKKVVYLKRMSMGTLVLDEALAPGEYRSLTKEEINGLYLLTKQNRKNGQEGGTPENSQLHEENTKAGG